MSGTDPEHSHDASQPLMLYQRGLEAARAGKLTLAWEVFSTLIGLDPENEEFWVQLARVAPPQLACWCWRRVLELNPDNSTARKELETLCGPNDDAREGVFHLSIAPPTRIFTTWKLSPNVN